MQKKSLSPKQDMVEFLQSEIVRRDELIAELKEQNIVLTRVALKKAESRVSTGKDVSGRSLLKRTN